MDVKILERVGTKGKGGEDEGSSKRRPVAIEARREVGVRQKKARKRALCCALIQQLHSLEIVGHRPAASGVKRRQLIQGEGPSPQSKVAGGFVHFGEANRTLLPVECRDHRVLNRRWTPNSKGDGLRFQRGALTSASPDQPPFTFVAPVRSLVAKDRCVDFLTRSFVSIQHRANIACDHKPSVPVVDFVKVGPCVFRDRISDTQSAVLVTIAALQQGRCEPF